MSDTTSPDGVGAGTGTSVAIADVVAAHARIAESTTRTPLLRSHWTLGDLWLKAENLQPTGAFKLRGATNAITKLEPDVRARGVVTHSSGNHGQAVAWAARAAGVPAIIVMPHEAMPVKIAATKALGAEVVLVPNAQREITAETIRAQRGMTLVPPYDHPDVIAGQGTLVVEVLEDLDHIDTVLVPVGGGGLISGVGVAMASLSPRTRVVGVEPALAADARQSLAAGRRIAWDARSTYRTVADGTRTPILGELTFPIIQKTVDEIVTVDEDEIFQAVAALIRQSHLVVEPSGALSVAAHLAAPQTYGRTVAVLSGGNIDPTVLTRALALTS